MPTRKLVDDVQTRDYCPTLLHIGGVELVAGELPDATRARAIRSRAPTRLRLSLLPNTSESMPRLRSSGSGSKHVAEDEAATPAAPPGPKAKPARPRRSDASDEQAGVSGKRKATSQVAREAPSKKGKAAEDKGDEDLKVISPGSGQDDYTLCTSMLFSGCLSKAHVCFSCSGANTGQRDRRVPLRRRARVPPEPQPRVRSSSVFIPPGISAANHPK